MYVHCVYYTLVASIALFCKNSSDIPGNIDKLVRELNEPALLPQTTCLLINPFPVVAFCIGYERDKQLTCSLTKQCDVFVYIYYSNICTYCSMYVAICMYILMRAHRGTYIDVCVCANMRNNLFTYRT